MLLFMMALILYLIYILLDSYLGFKNYIRNKSSKFSLGILNKTIYKQYF